MNDESNSAARSNEGTSKAGRLGRLLKVLAREREWVLMPDGRGLGIADTGGTAVSKSGVECERWNGVIASTAGAIIIVDPLIS